MLDATGGQSAKEGELFRSQKRTRPSGEFFRFTSSPTINILNGNRFMITSREGNITEKDHGLFRDDTRFLSIFEARINGEELIPLTSNNTTHYSAVFYLTNPELSRHPGSGSIGKESLSIERRRFIEEDVREEFVVTNVTGNQVDLTISFRIAADYQDLFEVKAAAFGSRPDMALNGAEIGDREGKITSTFLQGDNAVDFKFIDDATNFRAETLVWFSQKGKFEAGAHSAMSFDVSLNPKQMFHLTIVMMMLARGEEKRGRYTNQYFENEEKKIRRALEQWNMSLPHIETSWDSLKHSYYQSLIDLLFLRLPDPTRERGWVLLAAGCPWFMTLFGRDTLITSYQSLMLGAELARGPSKQCRSTKRRS